MLAAAVMFPIKNSAMRHECHRTGVIITHRGVASEVSALWSLALPSILLGVITQPFEWLARVVLSHQTNGYAELGNLQVAYSWGQAALFLPNQVLAPTLPLLANLWSIGDDRLLRRAVTIVFAITAAASLGTCAILVFTRGSLMNLYGKPFAAAAPVLVLIAIACALGGCAVIFRALLFAAERAWSVVFSVSVWGGIFTLLSLAWAADRAVGIGKAYLAAYGVHFIIMACMSAFSLRTFKRRVVGCSPQLTIRADIPPYE